MATIKQHRHVFPGYDGPDSLNGNWWHAVTMKHTKYPTAHDGPILGERDFTPGTRGGKVKQPEYSYDQYGELVISKEPSKGEAEAKFLEEAAQVAPTGGAVVFPDNEETAALVERTKVRMKVA